MEIVIRVILVAVISFFTAGFFGWNILKIVKRKMINPVRKQI